MNLEVSLARDPHALRREWETLCDRCSDDDAYLQPFFLLTWTDMVSGLWSPEFVTVRDGGTLVGLLPLYRRKVMGCRILGFPVSGSTPALDLIAISGLEEEVSRAIAASLMARRDWDLFWLHMIDRARAPAAAFLAALEQSSPLDLRDAGSTFVIGTDKATPEEFMQALPRRFRMEIERCTRRHNALGALRTVVCPDEMTLQDAMRIVDAILGQSWKGDEGDNQTVQRLQVIASSALQAGKLRLAINLVDDRPVSYLLSFAHADKLFPFHIAYDLGVRQISPGQVMLSSEVARAVAGDTREIDLGGGLSYLKKWATGTREFSEIRMIRKSIPSRILATLYLRIRDRRHAKARRDLEQRKDHKKQQAAPTGGTDR